MATAEVADDSPVFTPVRTQPDAPARLEGLVEVAERRAHLGGRADGRASSSRTDGTPNTAIASPMNFSTVPPWRSRITSMVAK